jgi:predicted DNA binding protein
MPRVQLRVNGAPVEDWLADASTEFPDADFSVLAALPTDDDLLDIVEVTTPDGDALVRYFEDAPEVHSFEVIHTDEQRVLIQFTIPVSETYNALVASGIIPQQPIHLQDGWYATEITASQERLSAYTEELATAGAPYQILSVTQSHDSSELLTDRQWEFITAAVERGFYETPRDCTLTELAETFDINLSAMSRLRHRAESRIITAFVAETPP